MRNKVDVDGIVEAAIQHAIKEQDELGVAVAAYLDGRLIVDAWGGVADEASGRPVQDDTLFNFFSVTKPFIAVALHLQAQRGLIDYNAPITRYWPEFGARGKDRVTVQDALTHRTGIPQMPPGVTPEQMIDWDYMIKALGDLEPLHEPGKKSAYHGFTWGWIVAELVQRTDPKKRNIQQFVEEEICKPLGIDDFYIGIPDHVESRIATLKNVRPPTDAAKAKAQTPAQAEVARVASLAIPFAVRTGPDIFGRADVRRAILPGMGGIGTARSVARLWGMLANGGELDGVRILEEQRVRWFLTPRPPLAGDDLDAKAIGMGGLHFPPSGESAYLAGIGKPGAIFGHGGSGGQVGWADLDLRLGVAYCHNRLIPSAPESTPTPILTVNKAVRKAAETLLAQKKRVA